jgi:hypothetical protein
MAVEASSIKQRFVDELWRCRELADIFGDQVKLDSKLKNDINGQKLEWRHNAVTHTQAYKERAQQQKVRAALHFKSKDERDKAAIHHGGKEAQLLWAQRATSESDRSALQSE